MNSRPNLTILMAAYESKSEPGTWKAFAAPFGITTEADTCEEAKNKIEELTDLYIEGLRKHGFPEHLINKDFADAEDTKILAILSKEVAADMQAASQQGFVTLARQRQTAPKREVSVPYYNLQFA